MKRRMMMMMVAPPPVGVGYRFNPLEEEIVSYYLKNIILGQPLRECEKNVILEANLYGENATPWDLFRLENEDLPWQIVVDSMGKVVESHKVLYVFTRLSSVSKNEKSKQKNRGAGCGSWHANSAAESVRDNYGLGKKIGSRRNFTFQSPEETVGQWTMYEYTIDAAANGIPQGINCQNYALCKLKRDDSKSSKGGRIVSRKRKIGLSMLEPRDTKDASFGKKKKSSSTATSEWLSPRTNTFRALNEETNNAGQDEGWTPAQETQCGKSVANAYAIEDGGVGYLPVLVDDDADVADELPCSCFPGVGEEDYWDPNLCFDADKDTFLKEMVNWPSP